MGERVGAAAALGRRRPVTRARVGRHMCAARGAVWHGERVLNKGEQFSLSIRTNNPEISGFFREAFKREMSFIQSSFSKIFCSVVPCVKNGTDPDRRSRSNGRIQLFVRESARVATATSHLS